MGSVESIAKHLIKLNNHKTNISFPAVVVNADRLEDGFVDVKPVVNYMNSVTGDTIEYPVLRDIRVVFPSSKSTTISFPLVQGDTVDLLFQSVDIEDFVNGNSSPHDPFSTGFGNLKNCVALVGFSPYQDSPFNPNNYKNEFNSQDLNIVHNKGTGLESSLNINTSGSIVQKAPSAITVDSPMFDVKSNVMNANNAVISTGGDVVVKGQSLNSFMANLPENIKELKQGNSGWTPAIKTKTRGLDEVVLEVYDWLGGEGEKPSLLGYIGLGGIVEDISQATNIRGTRGKSGVEVNQAEIDKAVDDILSVNKVMNLIQGQIDESSFSQYMKERIDDIEINKRDIAKETRDRVLAITETAKRIEAEAEERINAVRLLAEGQANIEGESIALVEAIDIERQERMDALMAVGDEILLEQQARIDSITELSEGFHQEIVQTKDDISAVDSKVDTLVIETGDSIAAVQDEITLKTDENSALSQKIGTVLAKTEENEAAVTEETRARTTALDAVAEDISTLTTKTGENEAALKEESRIRTEKDSALSEKIVTLTAETGNNKATIQEESEARTTALESVTKDITTLVSKTEDNEAAITKESETRTTAFDSLSQDIEVVSSKTDGNTASITSLDETFTTELSAQAESLNYLSSELDFGFTDKTKFTSKNRGTAWTFAKTVSHEDYTNAQMIRGLSADYEDSSARFTENIELLANKNESLATRTSNLSAQLVGGYGGNDLTKLNSGLLFEESKARATDVEGLAEQISLLSAGVGEQFDSFEIWHFNKDKDGWTGGTFSDGWINVKTGNLQSPEIIDLDGAVYKHVKLRIKKFGQPTWSGLLTHVGGSKSITEPSYDEDGVALANWYLDWDGDITSFTLKLASFADDTNYYSVDWIAVGRPSPAASHAALLRESKVRAAETSANASDLITLRSKIEGGNGVPIESSITKKLDTTANLASTTAEEVSTLKSTYDKDMYAYEGTVQSTARTLASETQAVAESLDLLSSEVKNKYTDKTKYTDKNRSMQWTFAKSVAADNYAANERINNLQSDFADSNANFTNELFTLAEQDKSIAADITQLYAETGANYGLIQDIDIAISTPNTGLAAKVTELQSSAANAQSTADQAVRDAQSKSEKAKTDAIAAANQYAAAEAKAKADAALLAANGDATTKANAAESAAKAAAALDAKNKADAALAAAKLDAAAKVKVAKDAADAAQGSADAAQQAANNAATAAGNKGEVIYSSTAPSADKQKAQNLWIDTSGGKNTPKRWASGAWLTVTDKAATDAAQAASQAQAAADEANQKLEPENLASLVEGSGAFSDEFGSISGQFANFEAVVEGQKTAMEVISGVGNAEKLKNEIAKARLDKDVTNLNAQSVALTNQINSYTAKISELRNKRDAPKPPNMSQSEYTALRAEYQKQIDDITEAKADLTAQKAVIADQVAQLAAEQKVLDDFKEVEDGVRAQHAVKVDNEGKVVGFGLVLQKDGFSTFDVRADRFSISAPSDKPNDVNGNSPFMVLTTPQNIDGVQVDAGTYMRQTYIAKASIDLAQIDTASITSLKALSATLGHFKSAETGARLEIKDSLLSVYDDNDVLRVRLGLW